MVQVDTPTPVPPAADTPVPPPTGAPPSAGPVDPESLINEKAGTLARDVGRAAEGLIERRGHSTDGRTRSLYLTESGKVASDGVLASRDEVIAEGLSILDPAEVQLLCDIAERVLRARLENLEHSYRICRLCCYDGCTNCPIDAELHERGVDREGSDGA